MPFISSSEAKNAYFMSGEICIIYIQYFPVFLYFVYNKKKTLQCSSSIFSLTWWVLRTLSISGYK